MSNPSVTDDIPSDYVPPSLKVPVTYSVSTLIVASDGQRFIAAVGAAIQEYNITGVFLKTHATAPAIIDTFVLCDRDSTLIALVNASLYRLNLNDTTPSFVSVSLPNEPVQHLIKPGTYLYRNDAVSETDDAVFFSTPRGIYQYVSSGPLPNLFADHNINSTIRFGKGLLVTRDHVYRSFEGGVAQWSRSSGAPVNNFLSNLTMSASKIILLQNNILFTEKQGFWDTKDGRYISPISEVYKVNVGIVSNDNLFVAAEGYQNSRRYRSLRGVWKSTNYNEERNCTAANFRYEYTGCPNVTALAMINTNSFISAGNGSICIYNNLATLGQFLFCGRDDPVILVAISTELIVGIIGGSVGVAVIMFLVIYAWNARRKRLARGIQRRAMEIEEKRRKFVSQHVTDTLAVVAIKSAPSDE